VNIGNLDITLHGGESWLYQLFIDVFESEITSAMNGAMASAISTEIDALSASVLSNLPVTEPVYNNVEIDFGMLVSPIFVPNNYFETQHSGEFYEISNPVSAPFSAPAIPDIVPTQMIQFMVSDFLPNTAGLIFYDIGILTVDIYPAMIPDFPFHLNTTTFCVFVPQLCKLYQDTPMMLNLTASRPAFCNLTSSGVNVTLSADASFYVTVNDSNIFVFSLDVVSTASGIATITDTTLGGSLTYADSDISLIISDVGTFRAGLFQNFFNALFSRLIIPDLNAKLAKGLALPTVDGVTFDNPSITYGEQYIVISTDITWDPTPILGELKKKTTPLQKGVAKLIQ